MANGSNHQSQTDRRTCPCKKLPLYLSSFTAAEYGDLHCLKKTGSSIADRVDQFGSTPLHLAAQNDHFAAVAMLLQLGCKVDGLGSSGATPLHRAAFSGAVASMRILLQHGASLFVKDTSFNDQMTPLHKAAAGGRYLAVQLLLQAFRAASSDDGRSKLAEALDSKDSRQKTPIEVAKELQQIQETERESVARWDQVAGGVADWDKCVQLLSGAAEDSRAKDDANLLFVPLPSNLTRLKDGCIDCDDEDGYCVTASWQAQFQAALGNSMTFFSTIEGRRRPAPAKEPEPPHSQVHVTKSVVPLVKRSNAPLSCGASCSMCGKLTIALYPTAVGSLVCKACKRSIR